MQDLIKAEAASLFEEMRTVRRHLHANPELSFEERETMSFICSKLDEHGISYRSGVAGTGIVADIQGAGPGPVVALRGDMDALPIQELSEVEYRSCNDGIMHACGHDVHTSCALGAAIILNRIRAEWKGTVRCIFQPGEERLPGGASLMIAEDVLLDPKVDLIIAQHVFPDLPVGTVGFRPGMYMASADEVYITVKGKGGHGAMPHLNIDPVLIAAHLITGLQQLVSRKAPPTTPTVLSFGKIFADGATNVIPDEVRLEGTFRTLDEKWRAEAHKHIVKLAEGICASMGGTCDVEVRKGYPFLHNDEALTESCIGAAKNYLDANHVAALPLRMTAEDFAYYSQQVPACFYRLGTASADMSKFTDSVHTPRFDIDEGALEIGMGMMAFLAVEHLG